MISFSSYKRSFRKQKCVHHEKIFSFPCFGFLYAIGTGTKINLEIEYNLSKEAVLKNSSIEKERHVLKVWANWYQEAVGKMIDINTTGNTKAIEKSISDSQQLISLKTDSLVSLLGEGNE